LGVVEIIIWLSIW